MQLSIKWNSTPTCRHEAIFVKSVVGIRMVVDTYRDNEATPCRTETGALGPMLAALLNPAGRYRLAPMLEKTFESQIESLFDAEPEPIEPNIHPVFGPILASIAPPGSIYAWPKLEAA